MGQYSAGYVYGYYFQAACITVENVGTSYVFRNEASNTGSAYECLEPNILRIFSSSSIYIYLHTSVETDGKFVLILFCFYSQTFLVVPYESVHVW
jgi:hypothetical protein